MPFRQFQHALYHRLTRPRERYRSLGLLKTQRRDRRYAVVKVQRSVLQWKRLRIQNIIEPNRYTCPVDRFRSLCLRACCSAAEPFAPRSRDRNPFQYSSPVKAETFSEITLNRCFISEVFFSSYPLFQRHSHSFLKSSVAMIPNYFCHVKHLFKKFYFLFVSCFFGKKIRLNASSKSI